LAPTLQNAKPQSREPRKQLKARSYIRNQSKLYFKTEGLITTPNHILMKEGIHRQQ